MTIRVGLDFGGNGSATTFVCTGFTKRYECVIILASEKHDEELNPEQLNEAYANFVENCYEMYRKPMEVRCDSAEQILIRGIKLTSAKLGLPIAVKNALKMSIGDRIKLVNKLVAQGRFKVHKNAKTVEDAMCEALWDLKHPDERLDNGSTDIDSLDALEYSLEPDMKNLTEVRYER
jgi:hypothetical protein